ncbi:MFS transporter [Nesterenkonia alkaliphila]|uniref:MFS transporter n=1 Tax=Nesterenkonia alkaliphila TaxID=1463631 RepID=A0A7K1UFF5_9MICC|nr:MFS transporter [Nesterenkonia alkaliphila]MVT25179.1 MFS transporter [Nesterenkonia alkaliphila]GFZ96216.1 MFS transporter [Nesterenkonia alkaliphila]
MQLKSSGSRDTSAGPEPSQKQAPAAAGQPGASQVSAATGSELAWAITGILVVFFAAMLSMNIVITALPVIVSELGGTQIQYSWVLTGLLLANASSTLVWGKLADMYSKKLLFQLANIIFFLSSLAAGFAPNMDFLIAARVVQGVGMGGLISLSMAIIASVVSPRQRGKYSGYIGAVLAVATAAGPLIGGLTVDTLGWRWCFWVGIPLCLLALVVVHTKLTVPQLGAPGRIDIPGLLLLVIGCSALLIWLSFAGTPEFFAWVSWPSALLFTGAALIITVFVLVERRVANPIVQLGMLRDRTTVLAATSSAAIAPALFSCMLFLAQYFQIGRGFSPTEAGLMLLPMVLGNMLGALVTGRLITRYGYWKAYIVAGSLVMSASMFTLAFILGPQTPVWLIISALAVTGLGFGAQMQNLMLVVQNTVPVTRVGQASSLIAFCRILGGAAGTAILGSVMAVAVGTASVTSANGINPVYAEATGSLFLIAACITLIAVVCNLLIKEVPLRTSV